MARQLAAALPRLLLALAAAALLAGGGASGGAAAKVIELDDGNFDALTRTGIWMVDIYAPWCAHCRNLEPVWRALADELKPLGINVAKIDGSKNRVLLMRFGVEAYPSIFLLRDGKSWQYQEARSVQGMKDFALRGYKAAKPMPFHKSPVSPLGRAMGALHSFPALAKRTYTHLKEDRGFSDLTIIGGALAVPLLIGGLCICLLDAVYTRQPHLAHQHYE